MKILRLMIDTKDLKLNKEDEKISPVEMSTRMISNVMVGYAAQVRGLLKDERRMIYNIEDILDGAIKEKKEEVELEDTQAGFIKKCFRETKMAPNTLLRRIEDNVEAIKDR